DKLTSGDKSVDLSTFELSRLFFILLSLGSLVIGDHERSSEEYLRDLDVEYHERALLDEEQVFVDEEVTQLKVQMALADDELTVGKSNARNGEWVNITIRKVNTLLSIDEDADWKNYLKYISIDLKFVEVQRLNLLSKYKNSF
nr:retrovirus-related Pol polyprotein from transposon TNT 1-94 [Tanacetum cinerariifolium]